MTKGFVASAFDLGPHAGHIQMLKQAKEHCDYLIVGLHVDPSIERDTKHKPYSTVSERYIQLKACKYVDEIIPYETEDELLQLMLLIMPDKRFLGSDYADKERYTGSHVTWWETIFINRNHRLSSSGLVNRIVRKND